MIFCKDTYTLTVLSQVMSTPAYAQLVDTDTESDPEEAPLKAEESRPLGSKVPLMSEEFEASEPSARMTVCTQPAISPGHSARVAKAMALSDSAFRKRYRSSYETASPSSSLTLSVQKIYRGTSELILDTDSEGDELGKEDTKEDDEDKSSDANDKREIRDDKSQGLDDEGHGLGDEDHGLDDKSQGLEDEGHGHGLEGEEAIPEGQQQVVPVVETAPTLDTWVDPEDGRVYTDIPAYVPLAVPIQTPPSPEWSIGSLPISSSSLVDVRELHTKSGAVRDEIFSQRYRFRSLERKQERATDVRELHTKSGAVRDEIFSQRYRFRSLERKQERATVTFRALRRPMLALETWAGHVDTRMEDMSRARYDDHRLIHDMLVQHAAMQCELQEMRGRVTTLEKEISCKEQ
nr:hypothetical protein [Tanacetum cinerariifolium]